MNINDVINIVRRVHDAEGINLGSGSTRDYRNAFWARAIGIVHHGHDGYNVAPDPQWHIKSAGGGRPQSDDVVVSMPSREFWDCIPSAGADGYSFRATGHGRLPDDQHVYAPPVPEGGGVGQPWPEPQPQPNPQPQPKPSPSATQALKSFHGTYLTFEQSTGFVVGNRTEAKAWEKVRIIRDPSTPGWGWIEDAYGQNLLTDDDGNVTFGHTDDQSRKHFGLYERDDKLSIQSGKTRKWLRMGSEVESYWVHFNGPLPQFEGDPNNEPGDYETFTVEGVASGPGDPGTPGAHSDPVVGVLTSRDGGHTISDDNGPRLILIGHMGDWLARFVYARLRNDSGQLAECADDLSDAREAGTTVIHTWARFAPHDGSPFLTPKYHGLEPLDIPELEDLLVEAIELVQSYGMRLDFGPGGLDHQTIEREREQARLYNRAIRRARVGVFQVFPCNEPSSVHGTSDWRRGEQDVAPDNLRELCRLMTDGTDVPFVLGHAHNENWNDGDQFCQKNYTHRDQLWGGYHAVRKGDVLTKCEHRSSWTFDYQHDKDTPANTSRGGKRLWLDMEGCGARANHNEAPPLISNVSVTDNGHQMENGGAQALIVASATLRGAGSQMSGNGVQRFKRFRETVGWFEIGWLIQQLPRDLHTYPTITHGGRGDALLLATGGTGDGYFRVDQVTDGHKVVGVGVCRTQGRRNSVGLRHRMRGRFLVPERREVREFEASGSLDLGDLGPDNFGVVVIAERV